MLGQNHDAISKQQSLYKVHFGKLSDHLYDSVNRDLKSVSMVRLDDKPSLDHWISYTNQNWYSKDMSTFDNKQV